MTYRAAPITQRDGSPLANSNCRMAAVATGIDYHTAGAITSTGAEMRTRQSDQVGGTDSGDAAEAWATYGQDLAIRDGRTWADLVVDLDAGRAVQLDVWHATAGGPCLSGSGAYGHSMAVAPERSGSRLLVVGSVVLAGVVAMVGRIRAARRRRGAGRHDLHRGDGRPLLAA